MDIRTGLRVAGAVAASIIIASCGVGQPGASPTDLATPETSPSPAASAGVASPGPAGCPNFVEVVETGPMPGDDGTEFGPVAREQQRISGDVQAAVAYGNAHPDEFASVRYENGPRVRLVIGFTGHIDEHCAALRKVLEYPDEFEIILQPFTEARLLEIQQEIVVMSGAKIRAVGVGAGTIDVQLRADGEALAEQIISAYGDIVTITVGMLPYPDRFAADAVCHLPGPILATTPFRVTVLPDPATVASGADFRGTATVTNVDDAAASLQTGASVLAVVFRPGSNQALGFYTGGRDSMGFGATLAPGESVDLPVLGSTASCDPALGYALPAGRYDVRALVDHLTMHDTAPTDIGFLLSEPAALMIEP